jgi:hypothetical protein
MGGLRYSVRVVPVPLGDGRHAEVVRGVVLLRIRSPDLHRLLAGRRATEARRVRAFQAREEGEGGVDRHRESRAP